MAGWGAAGVAALVFTFHDDARALLPEALRGWTYWILGSAAGSFLFWTLAGVSRGVRRDQPPGDG